MTSLLTRPPASNAWKTLLRVMLALALTLSLQVATAPQNADSAGHEKAGLNGDRQVLCLCVHASSPPRRRERRDYAEMYSSTKISAFPQPLLRFGGEYYISEPALSHQQTDLIRQGDSFQKSLFAGESHLYRVALESGRYLSLSIQSFNADVEINLYGSDAKIVREITCYQNSPVSVSTIARSKGVYALELRASSKSGLSASYELSVKEIRAAQPVDKHRITAETRFSEGERLRSESSDKSLQKAIESYTQAAFNWQLAGDKEAQSNVIKITGKACLSMGRPHQALNSYQKALALSQQCGDRGARGEILAEMAEVFLHLGRNREAKEQASESLALSREAGSRRREAYALNRVGEAYYALEDFDEAFKHYDQSLSLWHASSDARGQAQALLNLGYLHSDLSQSEVAIDYFDKATRMWRAAGDRRGQGFTLTARGNLYSRMGRKQEALDLYAQAAPLFEQTLERVGEAFRLNGLGHVYESWGEYTKSLGYYSEAHRLFQKTGYVPGIYTSLWAMGGIYNSIGDYPKAIVHFQKALSVIRSLGERVWESYVLRSLGMCYSSQKRNKDALDYLNKSLALFEPGEDPRGEAHTLNCIGSVYAIEGERQKALDYKRRALALNRKAGDLFGETSTLSSMARIERDEGRMDEARDYIEAAIRNIEISRLNVASYEQRASYLATARQSYDLYIDILILLDRKRPDRGLAMEALEVSERARARALLEMLTDARADLYEGVESALVERERALQQRINEKAELRAKLLAGRSDPAQIEEAKKELADAIAEYQQLRAQIRKASPRSSALTEPQILTAREIQQQLLDPDTLLLEYALGDDRSYLWAITQDSVETRALPSRAEIERVAREVYKWLTEPNREVKGESDRARLARFHRSAAQYWKAATELSRMILAPVSAALGSKRLLVVADGALQYIPFAALPLPQKSIAHSSPAEKEAKDKGQRTKDSYSPLILNYEISYLPSASILSAQRREAAGRDRASKSLAVIADPVFSKDDSRFTLQNDPSARPSRPLRTLRDRRERARAARLPFSLKEAERIFAVVEDPQAMMALSFDATRQLVLSGNLSRYRIVHFATHGFIDSQHPELSEILLSLVDREGRSQNGSLRLHEIYSLKFAAELVVLSACQTALGRDVLGEGLIGLTRGFMYAGAERVLASLWSVNDVATADLMERFYRKMIGEGLRPSAALRGAQREMFERRRWPSPYYWAAFTIQGEWK